jgi:molybdate transport system regulatory protein
VLEVLKGEKTINQIASEHNITPKNLQNWKKTFLENCKKVNIPAKLAHPHVLRHTRAIELIRNGIPITAVQTILGHSSLNTTAMYLKYSNTEIQAIMKAKGLL